MIRLMGALLTAGGMAWMGWAAARRLSRRMSLLNQLTAALEQMDREISYRLTPMPALLEGLAVGYPGPVGDLFARCRQGMAALGCRSLGQIWRSAVAATPLDLDGQALECLLELGNVLGQYEEEGMRAALGRAIAALTRAEETARAEVEQRGRMYRVLGVTAGGILVILLL